MTSPQGEFAASLAARAVIAFLNFNYPHEDEGLWDSDNFIAHYILQEKRTKEVAPSTISVNFVELRRLWSTPANSPE